MPVIVAPCLQTAATDRGFAPAVETYRRHGRGIGPGGERSSRRRPLRVVPARRLRDLPSTTVLGQEVRVATGFRARLLGLSHLDREQAGSGLLIPRCSGVHTFGMRFALDLVFLDREDRICSVRREVQPRRFVSVRRASAVLELPAESAICERRSAAQGGEFLSLRP